MSSIVLHGSLLDHIYSVASSKTLQSCSLSLWVRPTWENVEHIGGQNKYLIRYLKTGMISESHKIKFDGAKSNNMHIWFKISMKETKKLKL